MKDQINQIVDEVFSTSDMSEPEQLLEISTRIMKLVDIPKHQTDVGIIVDTMVGLQTIITGNKDPEKMAPEELDRTIEAGKTFEQ